MCDRNVIHCRFLESPDFLPNSAKRYIDQKFVLQVSTNFESYCLRNNPIKLMCYQRWSGWLVLWRKIKMPWDKHLLISKPRDRTVLLQCKMETFKIWLCNNKTVFKRFTLLWYIFVPCKWISVKNYTLLHKAFQALKHSLTSFCEVCLCLQLTENQVLLSKFSNSWGVGRGVMWVKVECAACLFFNEN